MATLKSLVDETTNIKNELKTCHSNLKNNLIQKGVTCSDNDKISTLINRVGEISTVKFIAGNSCTVYSNNNKYKGLKGDQFIGTFEVKGDIKSIRLTARGCSTGAAFGVGVKFKVNRNGVIVLDSKVPFTTHGSGTVSEITGDFSDIEKGDIIELYYTGSGAINIEANYVDRTLLLCDIVW